MPARCPRGWPSASAPRVRCSRRMSTCASTARPSGTPRSGSTTSRRTRCRTCRSTSCTRVPVLQHVAAREVALERMIVALQPGGWIVVEEADMRAVRGATAAGAARHAPPDHGRRCGEPGVPRAELRDAVSCACIQDHGLAEVDRVGIVETMRAGEDSGEWWFLAARARARPHRRRGRHDGDDFDAGTGDRPHAGLHDARARPRSRSRDASRDRRRRRCASASCAALGRRPRAAAAHHRQRRRARTRPADGAAHDARHRAKAADVSAATAYTYFSSKEHVFAEAYLDGVETLTESVLAPAAGRDRGRPHRRGAAARLVKGAAATGDVVQATAIASSCRRTPRWRRCAPSPIRRSTSG